MYPPPWGRRDAQTGRKVARATDAAVDPRAFEALAVAAWLIDRVAKGRLPRQETLRQSVARARSGREHGLNMDTRPRYGYPYVRGLQSTALSFKPLGRLQRYLKLTQVRRVVVPHAGVLATLVLASAVRMRRDFRQLLT